MPAKRKPRKGSKITLRITLRAPKLLTHEVAAYVRDAIDNYSGTYDGDDARRRIEVDLIEHMTWVPVEGKE